MESNPFYFLGGQAGWFHSLFFYSRIRIFVKKARVMTSKLTLTVEEGVIKKAKSYAKQTGRSLSELVENYLNTLTDEGKDMQQISPELKKIIGAVKLPDDFDEKAELRAYFEKKHL
jgi:hypothetical protein